MACLEGKCALVTGAGLGIGREVALEFARQGADVVLSYHASGEGAQSALQEIEALGRRGLTIQADLSQPQECFRLVDEAIAFLGRVDVLVNNAGVTFCEDFFQITPEQFTWLYALNIGGQYFTAQRAAAAMRNLGGGVIINMLSVHALAGFPTCSLYDGTKGAILAWSRELALELAPYHIRVVGVAPGAIEVPRYYDDPNYRPELMGQMIPWGRVGQPSDIAKTCAFLASDEADYILGTTVVVDGGATAGRSRR